MSGGHFDYKQAYLNELYDELAECLEEKENIEIQNEINLAALLVRTAYVYVQNIDWFISGDTGIEAVADQESIRSLLDNAVGNKAIWSSWDFAYGKRLMQISGVGSLTAVALVAHVGDARHFDNGRQMSAYLGLTPREHSSGGKQRLLGITKRGNVRLRTLLILGARAAIQGIERRKRGEDGEPLRQPTSLDRWILALKEKQGIFIAAVTLANKIARMSWVILSKGDDYNVSEACMAWEAA
jgi:hypothetical protein